MCFVDVWVMWFPQSKVLLSLQGLRVTVPMEAPPMIFATPTKYVSEAGNTVEYLGHNKVPDLQKLFQVQTLHEPFV